MEKQLEGVRVIDWTCFASGPSCGRMLAEWGAEVIKVEPLGGEAARRAGPRHFSPSFEIFNSGKRSLALDLKSTQGRELMIRLLETADVFLTSYRTKALKKLGLDYETLRGQFPGLVWAQVNGFGEAGPDADAPGFDMTAYWARSGALGDLTEKGESVLQPPPAFGDISASSSLAAGICAALYKKARTGRGEKVVTSLYAQAIYSMSNPLLTVQRGDRYPKSRKAPLSPLMNPFRCGDGKWLFVICVEYERYYNAICRVIGREDLVDDPRYCRFEQAQERITELVDVLDEGFARLTRAEAMERLEAADIACSPVGQIRDVLSDEQAWANQYLENAVDETGERFCRAATPVRFGDPNPAPVLPAPPLGKDSWALLAQLGYPEDEIEALRRDRVIYAPDLPS